MNKDKLIYLNIDPSMELAELCSKLNLILKNKVYAVQIWDNFKKEENIEIIINKIKLICNVNKVPIIIKNRLELLHKFDLDGIHFDKIQTNFNSIKNQIINKIKGITLSNNLNNIAWLNNNDFNYISFCSMFPSNTTNSCEFVNFETITNASKSFNNKIFLAGGISLENINKLNELEYDGIALISGIMNSINPNETFKSYNKHLNNK